MTAHRAGVLLVVVSACSYSLFAIFTKGVNDDLSPTDILFWRFTLATPVAWLIMAARRMRGGRGHAAPARVFFLAGLLFGGVALSAFAGLDHLSAALYTVVLYTYPAMVALGAWVFGRRPPRRLFVAIGVTLLGVAFTVPEVFSSPDADASGLVFTLLNAVLAAVYVLASGRLIERREGDIARRPDGFAASAWSFTGSLAFGAAVVAVVGVRAPKDFEAWAGLLGLAMVSTVIAGVMMLLALARLPAPTVALIAMLEPALTLVWAVVLLGESLAALQILGAALVIGGVAWSQRAQPTAVIEPG